MSDLLQDHVRLDSESLHGDVCCMAIVINVVEYAGKLVMIDISITIL